MNYKKIILYIYMVLLLVISVLPPEETIEITGIAPGGVWQHIAAFSVLTILAGWAYRRLKAKKFYLRITFFPIILGIIIESIQFFIPYRSSELKAFAVNSAGIIIGLVVAYFVFKKEMLKDVVIDDEN